jgi:branched-chain amino acid transport system substrate-binding protein
MNAVPCTDELGCVQVLPDEPILIAYMLDKSGPTQAVGLDSLRGIEMAIDEKMEILGHPIELTGQDSGCNPEIGTEVASAIVADPAILAVIGTTCSTTAWKAAPVISEAGLVMVSPSSSTPLLTAPDRHSPGFLRVIPSERELGVLAAQFAWEMLGVKTAATLYNDTHSDTLQQWFVEAFKELGGEITAQAEVQADDTHMHWTLAICIGRWPLSRGPNRNSFFVLFPSR